MDASTSGTRQTKSGGGEREGLTSRGSISARCLSLRQLVTNGHRARSDRLISPRLTLGILTRIVFNSHGSGVCFV